MEENEFNLIEDFKQLMRRAMVYAEKAHKFVFDEKTKKYRFLFASNRKLLLLPQN